jgi:hypothetical protein
LAWGLDRADLVDALLCDTVGLHDVPTIPICSRHDILSFSFVDTWMLLLSAVD